MGIEDVVIYRKGKSLCPTCDTAVYHSKTCILGAAERGIERLTESLSAALAQLAIADRLAEAVMDPKTVTWWETQRLIVLATEYLEGKS